MAKLKNVKFKHGKLYWSTDGQDIVLLRYLKFYEEFNELMFELVHILKCTSNDIGTIGEKIRLHKEHIIENKIRFRNARPSEVILYGKKET